MRRTIIILLLIILAGCQPKSEEVFEKEVKGNAEDLCAGFRSITDGKL